MGSQRAHYPPRRRPGTPRVPLDEQHHADLPPTGGAPCSNAYVVNTRGQAVGNDTDCHGHSLAAVLREQGPAYDLNRLIGRSRLHLAEAFYINNHEKSDAWPRSPTATCTWPCSSQPA